MNLREGTKYTVGIAAALGLAFACDWVSAKAYKASYPEQPAYKVEGSGPVVDLAALRRNWPQALENPEDRAKLLGFLKKMPKEVASNQQAGAPAAAPAAPEAPVDLATRLARADVDMGKRSANKCAACHTFDKGGRAGVGPNLWGVVGRPVASFPGFSYSDEMKANGAKNPNWTFDQLDIFLTNPQARVPGTRMTFAGLPNQQERANVIDYLHTLNDSPLPLPKPPG